MAGIVFRANTNPIAADFQWEITHLLVGSWREFSTFDLHSQAILARGMHTFFAGLRWQQAGDSFSQS